MHCNRPSRAHVVSSGMDTSRENQIRNSIAEGRNILSAGTFNGRKLSTPELFAVRMSVENDLAKIGESRIANWTAKNYTITDVTPAGY